MRAIITFHSEWHCGSGTTGGADIDTVALKDINQLPYLPGKTLKGLLREQADLLSDLGAYGSEEVTALFGTRLDPDKKSETAQGSLRFNSAQMAEAEAREFIGQPALAAQLYRRISATAIDKNGIAKDKSLRSVEVVVPLTLYATIEGPQEAISLLKEAASLVKCAGLGRNRGFGACTISIEESA